MAELAVDFTNDQSRFEQVIIQRGKDVLDGELNEIGRLIRVSRYRQFQADVSDDAHEAGNYGMVRTQGLDIVPRIGVPTDVSIVPNSNGRGLISFRGYVFEITSTIHLTGVTTGALGTDEYQQVYMTIAEEEVTAVDDPSIAVQDLGETARRVRLVVTFALGGVNTDTAGPLNTAAEPWEGGTKSAVLAYIKRVSGTATFIQAHVFNRCVGSLDFQGFQDRSMIKLAPAVSGTGAYASWDLATSTLTFSNVCMRVPGVYDNANNLPVAMSLPSSVVLPNDGDALVLRIPRGRRYVSDSGNTGRLAFSVTNLSPNTLEAEVTNLFDFTFQFEDAFEEGMADRIVIAVRLPNAGASGDRVLFCNGQVLDPTLRDATLVTTPGEGRVYFGNSSTLETHQDGVAGLVTSSAALDAMPYWRGRYMPVSGSMRLIDQFLVAAPLGTDVWVRRYMCRAVVGMSGVPENGVITTYNARWNPATSRWVADDVARGSTAQIVYDNSSTVGAIQFLMRGGGDPSPWAHTAWTRPGVRIGGGGPNNTGLFLSNTLDPAPTDNPSHNYFYSAMLPKAWAMISTDGVGGVTLLDGIGIASVGFNAIAVRITLQRSMASVNFLPMVQNRLNDDTSYNTLTTGAAIADVYARTGASGGALDLTSSARTFGVAFYGRHS